MARILLWNSLTTRRRSASDTFFDNGLGVLAAHLEARGHSVWLEDWATDEFFADLTLKPVARLLRPAYGLLLGARRDGPPPVWVKVLGGATMGLQEVQSALQRRAMEARLRDLAWRVVEEGVPIVGVKLWYGEAFGWARRFAELVRERDPEVVLIAGGYHATLYEEEVLRRSPFDLAVRGEGEFALTKILDLIDAMPGAGREAVLEAVASRRFENVLWREPDGTIRKGRKRPVKIVKKAVPRYGDRPGKVRIHVLLESLGCPWGKCHFCVHPHFYKKYAPRPVEDVIAEMQAMVAQGIGIFRFAGSDTPPAFGARIAEGILDAGLQVVYGMGSRAVRNAARPEVFERTVRQYEVMLRSGLRAVFIGGETGHDRINDQVMNKGVTRSELVATARAIREAEARTGIHIDVSLALIYPTPLVEGVTDQEVFEANLELLREFQPDSVMVTPPGPFKHSRWYTEKERFGFEFEESVIPSAMEYEYVLYKPPSLWPRLDIGLQGRSFVRLLEECGRFRKAVEAMGIPTDISDEHFLMLRAAGYEGRDGAEEFKRETLLDIVSCDYRTLLGISRRINAESRRLATASSSGSLEENEKKSSAAA
ncbi:B12-binding domain-containing radical SAM protein [Deferrisoma camini]|uniref:B12-binding domain-containing radical SAM protein n=1 Tax=Deferrisoma camini TaxID=1035120 RepID=UPI00046D37F2|nr:B12-binding domain-containing radical SAM protein [Deferrisoma camini]